MAYNINWSTIAPESRLFKGSGLYKWEDSPGLEHHCGVCATPLHNSRARTTCIGKHVEPCYRFHQQLHFVGKGHECFGCNTSDETHHTRHKEILKLVREVAEIDGVKPLPATKVSSFENERRNSTGTDGASTTEITESGSETIEGNTKVEKKLTKRQKKKMKKSSAAAAKALSMESFPNEQLDFVSEAIHLIVHDNKGAWAGGYSPDHHTSGIESCAIRPGVAAGEQGKEEDSPGVVHLSNKAAKSIQDMTPRQRRTLKTLYTPTDGSSRRFDSKSPPHKPKEYDDTTKDIFVRLGVPLVHAKKNSKERKTLIIKLVAAVREDLDIMKREEDEITMRGIGFWRWAGNTAFHAIAETREKLDWVTGQKKVPTTDIIAYVESILEPEGFIEERSLIVTSDAATDLEDPSLTTSTTAEEPSDEEEMTYEEYVRQEQLLTKQKQENDAKFTTVSRKKNGSPPVKHTAKKVKVSRKERQPPPKKLCGQAGQDR